MESHLYWKKHLELNKKIMTTIPKNGQIKHKVTADNRNNNRVRIRDIFWECEKIAPVGIVEKSPVFYEGGPNPDLPLTLEWNVTLFNNSKENIDVTIYALEEEDIGLVQTES
ncbi:hypothetical protein [Paenibacillus sp. O199]|uniref:hypothetical protein n=1 Tax=Paenibacillus sp. O199 TaxID=1643925 RepID=UPI0007BF08DD|nr:hypothetical protein [Paenibacillus sp. O199]